MGFFDFLKRKELQEISSLKKRCDELAKFAEIADLDEEKERILASIEERRADIKKDEKQHREAMASLEKQHRETISPL